MVVLALEKKVRVGNAPVFQLAPSFSLRKSPPSKPLRPDPLLRYVAGAFCQLSRKAASYSGSCTMRAGCGATSVRKLLVGVGNSETRLLIFTW
jgi:hypothetical protein